MHKVENVYRLWKSRVVTLWFSVELRAIAIPNITYTRREDFALYLSGLEKCSVVAFSTKGHIESVEERLLLIDAVKHTVDNLSLKTIIVYSACGDDKTSLKLFDYAIKKGIAVVIPNNSLRERNSRRA